MLWTLVKMSDGLSELVIFTVSSRTAPAIICYRIEIVLTLVSGH